MIYVSNPTIHFVSFSLYQPASLSILPAPSPSSLSSLPLLLPPVSPLFGGFGGRVWLQWCHSSTEEYSMHHLSPINQKITQSSQSTNQPINQSISIN
jgi:hypothetical protein